MNILQVSISDRAGGGEAIALRLFEAYRAAGHRSILAVGNKQTGDPDIVQIPNNARSSRWERSLLAIARRRKHPTVRRFLGALSNPRRGVTAWLGRDDFDYPASRDLLSLVDETPDIVQCHNLHGGYFDLRVLPALSRTVPVVLTLHDAWLLSGHCAHSFDCERWLIGCGHCPYPETYPRVNRDATAHNWAQKRSIYAGMRVRVASASRWLLETAGRSMLADSVIESRVIPDGVDTRVFHPGDASEARRRLGIDSDAIVFLAVGRGYRTNEFKDFRTLHAAVARVSVTHPRVICIILGEDAPSDRAGSAEIQFRVAHERGVVADYYRAADVYLHPARADTFPNAVLEAMACGTPVVAARVGGIPEQIDDGRTGMLVPAGDDVAMANAIDAILGDGTLRSRMRDAAIDRVQQFFTSERQVDAYLDWFKEIMPGKFR